MCDAHTQLRSRYSPWTWTARRKPRRTARSCNTARPVRHLGRPRACRSGARGLSSMAIHSRCSTRAATFRRCAERAGGRLSPRHALSLAARSAARQCAADAAEFLDARRQRHADLRPDESRSRRRADGYASTTTSSISAAQSSSIAGACFERIAVRNFGEREHSVTLELRFGADFADLFEVRGRRRARRGEHASAEGRRKRGAARVHRPRSERRTHAHALRPHAGGAERRSRDIPVRSAARAGDASCISRSPATATQWSGAPLQRFFVCLRDARRRLRGSSGRAAAIETDNEVFNEAVRRSVADLYMLITNTPEGPYPYAGIPWFSTAFGRDALITALMMLWMDPAVARGVLRFLAANQATTIDPVADAEPGKILHELRYGEMAELGEVPFRRYYGSVDSTPLFVMLAGAYFDRTDDILRCATSGRTSCARSSGSTRTAIATATASSNISGKTEQGPGEPGVERQLRFRLPRRRQAPRSRRSHCARSRATSSAHAIAAARIARALGHDARADAWSSRPRACASRSTRRSGAMRSAPTPLALDRDKRPCLVRSSNAGHLLLAGVPSEAAARARWRRSCSAAASFRAGACGRWPAARRATIRCRTITARSGRTTTRMIALGFGRYGLRAEAARILEGLFDASAYIDLRRLPELICGFPRRLGQGPTFYPPPVRPRRGLPRRR